MSRFLEYAVGSDDLLESIAFYRQLGFSELPTSDGITDGYAVVSDGRICIGLHEPSDTLPAIRIVQANIRRLVIDLATQDVEFSGVHIGEDELHEASLKGPFGNTVTWIEARTFSPPDEETHASALGRFVEVTMPVGELLEAARFWAPFADTVIGEADEPAHMRMQIGTTAIGLRESRDFRSPLLSFVVADKKALQSCVDRFGFELEQARFDPDMFLLHAPEGTTLAIRSSDYIGH
ncbi:MAG: hypothetical protein AAGC71_08895 [Pseudomonadota bacterium]